VKELESERASKIEKRERRERERALLCSMLTLPLSSFDRFEESTGDM
jgi:hypothetical protein